MTSSLFRYIVRFNKKIILISKYINILLEMMFLIINLLLIENKYMSYKFFVHFILFKIRNCK